MTSGRLHQHVLVGQANDVQCHSLYIVLQITFKITNESAEKYT